VLDKGFQRHLRAACRRTATNIYATLLSAAGLLGGIRRNQERHGRIVERINQLLLSYPEAMAALGGIGKTKFFEILPELEKVNIGRRTFVTTASVERYVRRLTEEANA
jgi:hypothetical protein